MYAEMASEREEFMGYAFSFWTIKQVMFVILIVWFLPDEFVSTRRRGEGLNFSWEAVVAIKGTYRA